MVGSINQHQDQKQPDRSNVFKGFTNDDDFRSACIVIMFNIMAMQDKKALKTQLAMSGVRE